METTNLIPSNNTALSTYTEPLYTHDVTNLLSPENSTIQLIHPAFALDAIDLYNAIQSPDKTVNECIGDEFNLVGIIAHNVECINKSTGELEPAPRIVLLASNGDTYVSVSKTLFSSLKNLLSCFRDIASWGKDGLPVKLRQSASGEKRYFSLEIRKPNKKK